MADFEQSPDKSQNSQKKTLINGIANTVVPTIKELTNDDSNLPMPELALRCAQFFHSISKYCMGYYRNYKRDEDKRKTKNIKKRDFDKKMKDNKIKNRGKNYNQTDVQMIDRPQPPKKPLTAYIIYFQDKKPSFVDKYPSLNLSQLTKLIAKEWKELTQDDKKVYLDKASDDRKRYEEQIFEFKRLYEKISGEKIQENPLRYEDQPKSEEQQQRQEQNNQSERSKSKSGVMEIEGEEEQSSSSDNEEAEQAPEWAQKEQQK